MIINLILIENTLIMIDTIEKKPSHNRHDRYYSHDDRYDGKCNKKEEQIKMQKDYVNLIKSDLEDFKEKIYMR